MKLETCTIRFQDYKANEFKTVCIGIQINKTEYSLEIYPCMYMTKVPVEFKGKRIIFSTKDPGTSHKEINERYLLPTKIKLKWIIVLNVQAKLQSFWKKTMKTVLTILEKAKIF